MRPEAAEVDWKEEVEPCLECSRVPEARAVLAVVEGCPLRPAGPELAAAPEAKGVVSGQPQG